jgi:hypothetical protein
MKKSTYYIFTFFAAFAILSTKVNAQSTSANSNDYQIAAGLKFGGYESGISGKYFINNNTALEGILGFRAKGVVFTGLYEIHQVVFNVPALKFYYGFGAHIGGVGKGEYNIFNRDPRIYANNQILFGVDGVIGLAYKIPKVPIALSLDLNPRIELATGPYVDIAPGLGIKYTF